MYAVGNFNVRGLDTETGEFAPATADLPLIDRLGLSSEDIETAGRWWGFYLEGQALPAPELKEDA